MVVKSYPSRKAGLHGLVGALLTVAFLTVAPAFTPSAEAHHDAVPAPGAPAVSTPPQVLGSVEAQKSYRLGRQAQEGGDLTTARRHYLEAARLDPTFADPHFALASSYLPFRPDAACSALTDGIRAQWSTFRGQHRLVMNICLFVLAVLAGSLMATGFLLGMKGLQHFQHPIQEVLQKKTHGGVAALIAWVIVIQPILWGMGLYLTLTLVLGLLWAYLNKGEKKLATAFLFVAVLIPVSFHGLSRLTAPLNPESIPYLLSAASETPDVPGLAEALTRVSQASPGDSEPHLALGLVAERRGDSGTAEAEYRKALELGGSPARAGNNLGKVLFETGRLQQAADQLLRAVAADPKLAAPHFNLGQVYAKRLQFDLVDQEMRLASQLDFEGMRAAMTQDNGSRRMISLGAAPSELWKATLNSRTGPPMGVPKSLKWIYDGSLTLLPLFTLLLFGVGFIVGGRIHQFLPTYTCANCATVVCRKCLRRIRRRAYCVNCGDTILSLKTSEFTRMLLDRKLHEEAWPRRVAHFLLILIIPGWEAIRRGRPFVALSVITIFMAITVPTLLNGFPVKAVPSLVDVPGLSRWLYFAGGLVVLYGLSALILRALPEPESALMEAELGMVPNSRPDRLDRVA
jgi:tetratricopeptide (TPR) repeat protein